MPNKIRTLYVDRWGDKHKVISIKLWSIAGKYCDPQRNHFVEAQFVVTRADSTWGQRTFICTLSEIRNNIHLIHQDQK